MLVNASSTSWHRLLDEEDVDDVSALWRPTPRHPSKASAGICLFA